MDVTEMLQFIDRLVENQTGKHLDDLQKNIVQGLWEGKTYQQMAEDIPGRYSENYIGDESRKLFKVLSDALGDEVKKANFCWTLERAVNSQVVQSLHSHITCPTDRQTTSTEATKSTAPQSNHDLSLAPKIRTFCDRTTELSTLSDWLCNQNIPLISVVGIAGIGKTTLVKRWIDLNLEKFDTIIWKSIPFSPSLNTIIEDILTTVNPDTLLTHPLLTQLFQLLRDRRCLLVLDDFQHLFIPGQLAGHYKPEAQDYQTLLTKITEIDHQSTLLVISQEKNQQMMALDTELYPIKCLELGGFDTTELLKNFGLGESDSALQILKNYEGHPIYLKQISSLIQTLFSGNIAEFLTEDHLILTQTMQTRMKENFNRLSPPEQEIALHLSQSNLPISREQLRADLSLSSTDLINGLDSLKRRYLLTAIESEGIAFDLSPVFREYVISLT
ncbi:NB-ARC domain-containing protein [Roseofilum sp. BLCC_M154]|uniref:NB-ARC domain-containing protein n=1 Tax=Roseofilum acuticapitatum BLCC-M154 TaxID=3022444 RepID=A0ABT7AZ13_9CYAN|nr:NB-ARC domain-containing protein [Roseofilum acuticapitatum]MDJ1172120.1 NB-ARC domain-containing protein [Roseofilum acuticapitatum BLCC-M154]